MNIVLIGYRGSGKSAAGRVLADRLGWSFVDTDALIQERSGMTIRDIYADQAEDGFRDRESEVVAEVGRLDRHVISTGGGTIIRPINAEALKRNGRLVWLAASAEVLWQRISADAERSRTRPSTTNDSAEGLKQVRASLREREPVYAGWADHVVDTASLSPEAVADEVLRQLGVSGLELNSVSSAAP